MTNNNTHILIVEDEAAISRFITLELQHEGYETTVAANGREGLELALAKDYALIVLDVMLPDLNGIEVLRRLRATKQTPVIILTARDTVMDKVSGLDLGASDYMTKPFAIEELLARIRANLKKLQKLENPKLSIGELVVDVHAYKATFKDEHIELTKKEFDLLVYLLENRNTVLSREKILEVVWGFDFYGNTNVVDVYIRYLRSKIDDKYNVNIVETVRGAGYTIR